MSTTVETNGSASHASNGVTNGMSKASDDIKAFDNQTIDQLAMSPCDIAIVPSLINEITASNKSLGYDRHARLQMLKAARSLVRALETPREAIIRTCWAENTLFGAIDTAISMGIFPFLAKDGGSPKNVDDLAALANVDPSLLGRLMKHMGSMGVITEVGPDEYKPTNLSIALSTPKWADGFPCISQSVSNSINKLPQYFTKTGFKNPTNATDGPFQFAYSTNEHWFHFAHRNQPVLAQFNNHMSAYRQGRPSWMDPDFFPVEELLIKGASLDPDAVFLVDIGGNIGHDIAEFHQKHPDVPGRLILQDLPPVIEQIEELGSKIERMPYDFFTPQPIIGARAYYLHSVLHDWPDDKDLEILNQITSSMKPGYSKLLINENVIPTTGADWQNTGQDLMMMSMVSSQERKEEQWRHLLKQAGLKVLNIWSYEPGVESLIECELA